jgi:hypothetical protein
MKIPKFVNLSKGNCFYSSYRFNTDGEVNSMGSKNLLLKEEDGEKA